MINNQIADILEAIADYLELEGVNWKPIAYRRAAMNIRSLSEDLSIIYKNEGLKGLENIPSVGEHIAKKIEEFIKTGTVKKLGSLKKEVPINLEELKSIEGLGPKKIMFLFKKLKIKDMKGLEKALLEGKLRKLEGFGEKTEENLKKSIAFKKSSGNRKLISYALPLAEKVVSILKQQGNVDKTFIAGSLSRRKETIGDIDILITSKNPELALNQFSKSKEITRILAEGPTKLTFIMQDIQVDIRAVKPDEFGSAVQYFVGSKEHNIEIRKIAIKKGLKLSEYGLFDGSKKIAGENEEEIYQKLGMDWIPFEIRENDGEIQAALKHQLPKLIELKNIRGDTHLHTTSSDGSNSIEEMASACQKKGYEWCIISDHLGKLAIANAMNEKEIIKQKEEIKRLNKKMKNFTILHGAEVDINDDGSLAADFRLLAHFDLILAGIHTGFKKDKESQTKRIIKAMDKANIIVHPTGRLINEREGYDLDFEKIFRAAKEKNVALELNSFPNRLDLNSVNVRAAKEAGVTISIGTDSHSTAHLDFMRYGVFTARRGWCEKEDILNTLSATNVLKKLKK